MPERGPAPLGIPSDERAPSPCADEAKAFMRTADESFVEELRAETEPNVTVG